MAIKNKIIVNPVTGQQIKFLQTRNDTSGALLEMESSYRGHSVEPAPHYHPNQDEIFTMISGAMSVRLNGTLKVMKAGDSLYIPRNTIHSMWNDSDTTAVVNWKIEPALNTEYFFETAMGLANDNKTNKNGMPNLLQAIALIKGFSNEIKLVKPPQAIQKILFILLLPVTYVLGYRARYEKYID